VQQQELQLARQWKAQRAATPAQKQYAAALLGAGGEAVPSAIEGGCGTAALEALAAERQACMVREVERRVALATGGAAACGDPDAAPERPSPVLRMRLSGVVPSTIDQRRPGGAAGLGDAILRLWRVSEEEEGSLREGDVLRVTGLRASRSVDLGLGRMLQLDMTKLTR
jgi:hypothetical protein